MKLTDEQLEYLQPSFEDRHRIEQDLQQQEQEFLASLNENQELALEVTVEQAIEKQYFEPSKSNVNLMARYIANEVADGKLNALELNIRLKALKDFCEQTLKMTEDAAIIEAEKYPKGQTCLGATVEIRKSADRYKFDNSPAIVKLEEQLSAAKELAKTLAKGNMQPVFDTTTGEEIKPAVKEEASKPATITIKHAA